MIATKIAMPHICPCTQGFSYASLHTRRYNVPSESFRQNSSILLKYFQGLLSSIPHKTEYLFGYFENETMAPNDTCSASRSGSSISDACALWYWPLGRFPLALYTWKCSQGICV
jgi:hypothetical protein